MKFKLAGNLDLPDQKMDTFPLLQITKKIEKYIKK